MTEVQTHSILQYQLTQHSSDSRQQKQAQTPKINQTTHHQRQLADYRIKFQQKMEQKHIPTSSRVREATSVCEELNLDIEKLDDESLLENPTYLRLYSIVKNDMSRSDLSFRKNLIRELYFLLQITPIIRAQLKEQFLEQVEKMYNLHDHKKIDLASSKLNNLLSMVQVRKDSTYTSQQRPKSGVSWNRNVPSFLRPYTATRPKPAKPTRPQSSKFNCQSTKISNQDIYIRQFTTNIQQQLEISKDFLEKHRTSHPQYEPVYEQLYNILKAVESPHQELPKPQTKVNLRNIKYPKSAVIRNSPETWIRPQQSRESQHLDNQEDHFQEPQQQRRQQQSDNQSSEEEYLFVSEAKKQYKPYSNTVKIEEAPIENNKDNCIKKYSHLIGNKWVQSTRQDEEIAQKYVNYTRTKSAIKRQINRRNESKRIMANKTFTQSAIKYYTKTSSNDKENQQTDIVVDLTKDPLSLTPDTINPYPTYNRNQFLRNRYQRPVSQFKKRNNVGYSEAQSADHKAKIPQRPMTSFTRFHSPIRFDPLSPENVRQYNSDVLEQIEKIKAKMGGKCYASTESLMKALAVVEVDSSELPSWSTKNPGYGMVSQGRKKLKKRPRKGKSSGKAPANRR